jgi:hypothetical protein
MTKLKEIGKDIINGLWYMGVFEIIGALFLGVGFLTLTYPGVMVPTLLLVAAWLIGKFMRG